VDDFIDDMNHKIDFDSSVVVVQPIENGLVDKLNEQEGHYTLYKNGIENGRLERERKIVKSISRGINPYEDFESFKALGQQEALRFVFSNTTEAGIAFNEKDKLEDQPQRSFPGKVTRLLYERYQYFKGDEAKGLIFIPCELIEKNGDKLKEIVLEYAKLWELEAGFTKWVNEANAFCNSLVDRIVPGYPRERMDEITKELGYKDDLVVEGERFHLWVIEGDASIRKEFPADKAGLNVIFTDDLTPYRTRKVRILNGAHTSMVPVGLLYGLTTVRETLEDASMGKYVNQVIAEEIIPTLDLPKEALESYGNAVLERFQNPYINHQLMSISLNSNPKYETRILPSLIEYRKRKGSLPKKMVFSLASMIMLYRGEYKGMTYNLKDSQELLDMYQALWGQYDGTKEGCLKIVEVVLARKDIWKVDLNNIEGLATLTSQYLYNIEANGMEMALKEMI
jgi:tagaturonate reductase